MDRMSLTFRALALGFAAFGMNIILGSEIGFLRSAASAAEAPVSDLIESYDPIKGAFYAADKIQIDRVYRHRIPKTGDLGFSLAVNKNKAPSMLPLMILWKLTEEEISNYFTEVISKRNLKDFNGDVELTHWALDVGTELDGRFFFLEGLDAQKRFRLVVIDKRSGEEVKPKVRLDPAVSPHLSLKWKEVRRQEWKPQNVLELLNFDDRMQVSFFRMPDGHWEAAPLVIEDPVQRKFRVYQGDPANLEQNRIYLFWTSVHGWTYKFVADATVPPPASNRIWQLPSDPAPLGGVVVPGRFFDPFNSAIKDDFFTYSKNSGWVKTEAALPVRVVEGRFNQVLELKDNGGWRYFPGRTAATPSPGPNIYWGLENPYKVEPDAPHHITIIVDGVAYRIL